MDIKGEIKARGYTLIWVAEKMKISKGAISQIVNGSPNVKTLRTIADIIGCKVGDFFKDEMSEVEPAQIESSPVLTCPHCGKEIHITLSV